MNTAHHTKISIHDITESDIRTKVNHYNAGQGRNEFFTLDILVGGHEITLFVMPDQIAGVIANLLNTQLPDTYTPLPLVDEVAI